MTNINIKRRFQEQELPDMKTLQAEVDKIAGQVTIGETLFMKKHGVKSEGEYKKKMAAQVSARTVTGWPGFTIFLDVPVSPVPSTMVPCVTLTSYRVVLCATRSTMSDGMVKLKLGLFSQPSSGSTRVV